MTIICPTCKNTLETGAIEGCDSCPSCGEPLDMSALRAAICPICGCGFEEGDEIRICPDCKTPHHDECWTENHGCSTYGCASAAHQETHTTESIGSGQDGVGMIPCPACGAMHPATDLVCGACGKLLGENLPGDSAWARLRESAGRNIAVAKAEFIPRLVRNLRLLGSDMAEVFRLWWAELSRYVDFSGTTDRRSFVAFTSVTYLGLALLSKFEGDAGASTVLDKWVKVVRIILSLALLLPSIAICVRRLRDTDISPWMVFAIPIFPFLLFVPTVKVSNNLQSKEVTA